MSPSEHLFILKLDDQRYALPLSAVARVVRMVEITAMPNAPAAVLGLINVQGEILQVIDLRCCFHHPPRQIEPQDVLVIAGTADRKVALAADTVAGVIAFHAPAIVSDQQMLRHSNYLEGVVKHGDGLVLVCNLDKILAVCAGEASGAAPEGHEAWEREGATSGELRDQLPRGEAQETWADEKLLAAQESRSMLKARAHKLAREPVTEEAAQRLEIVEFVLSGERYAVESSFVREVYPLRELTPLPCTPGFVLGIVNMRGTILSVIDLRKFFDLPEQGLSDLNKVIILYGLAMEFGILADAIVGVRTIQASELQPSLPTLTEIRADYLKGVTKDRLVVLDAGRMLSDHRIVVHEEA